ncbi:alpha-N-arabinofuranosidase [Glaciecola sp. 1036]|uniref:alpha-N-arabinofuranosidase n=1 Tax=Alteromonadaceae TaxID=72275 RepID=UPI003D0425F6
MKFKSLLRAIGIALTITSTSSMAEVSVSLDTDNTGAVINKNIYGQFMEHLGRGIYEGVWVGPESDIPNTNGYRDDVLQALKDLQVPLLRWPGGCFADEYHWEDGIGPNAERKRTVNTTWGGVIDDNSFGTHEFMNLAEMLGADAYVNGNLGTGSPKEMAQWVEYMTSDSESSLANLRRENGRDKPWRLHFFAIGNETWGCGGSMDADYYVDLYKHYATFIKTPANNKPTLIASGGTDFRTDYTEALMSMESYWSYNKGAISHHYYTLPTSDWSKKGSALNFPESEWASTMSRTLKIEDILKTNIEIMDKYDPDEEIGFYLDEWGTWYDVTEGDPGFLYQQNSLRDAVVAALNLNIYHKYAKRVQMTIIAQMVNVLQAMILTDKEKMLLTPTYHVFRMHIPFQDATYVPIELDGNETYGQGEHQVPKINASAARGKDGKLWITLVNVDPNNDEVINLGSAYKRITGEILTAETMDAHNTFKDPNAVRPTSFEVSPAENGELVITLPPKAIIVAQLTE